MKITQKYFIATLLVALVAILLIGGGVYVYMQNKQATSTAQTSDLKTYTNAQYGFTFQYPSSFGIPKEHISTPSEKLKNSPDSVNFLDGRLIVSSGISYNLSTSQPMTFDEVTSGGSNRKQIVVGGIHGIQISSSQVGTVTSIPLSGNVIVVIAGSPDLQNQILPTFRLTTVSQTTQTASTAQAITTINATFCDSLYIKDPTTFIVIKRDSAYKPVATTTVDYRNISNITHFSYTTELVSERNGKTYTPETISLMNWLKYQNHVGDPTGKECAPGGMDIAGTFNDKDIFIASSIVEHGQ